MSKIFFLYDHRGDAVVVRRPIGFDRAIEIEEVGGSQPIDTVAGTLATRTPEWWETTHERAVARRRMP